MHVLHANAKGTGDHYFTHTSTPIQRIYTAWAHASTNCFPASTHRTLVRAMAPNHRTAQTLDRAAHLVERGTDAHRSKGQHALTNTVAAPTYAMQFRTAV